MKPFPFISSILTLSLSVSAPHAAFAHVGHGDEFQATGGVNRVEVKAETDSLLGIEVNPIEPATDGSATVLIPAIALVDADGRQLVFVQYENFYEPVEVIAGETRGEFVEITKGLSVGEQLVTKGSLSLYAESRKTQTADTASMPEATSQTPDDASNLVGSEAETARSGLPMGILAAAGGGIAIAVGAIVVIGNGRKKNSI